jgi:hypothetical protein
VYCALYPQLAKVARKHGYALAIHGTLGRDMDLICVPWADAVSAPSEVVREIVGTFWITQVGEPTGKNHGREAWTISIGHGECALDLSFLPSNMDRAARNIGVGLAMVASHWLGRAVQYRHERGNDPREVAESEMRQAGLWREREGKVT